jgi:hypothetical protein
LDILGVAKMKIILFARNICQYQEFLSLCLASQYSAVQIDIAFLELK